MRKGPVSMAGDACCVVRSAAGVGGADFAAVGIEGGPGEVSPLPLLPPAEHPMPELISRQNKSTSEVAVDVYVHMSECTHAEGFGGESSWGHNLPRAEQYSQHGHCSTSWCIDGHPDRRQHWDRLSVVLTAADKVEVEDAIAVLALPPRLLPLPRSQFARASLKLQHCEPALPPHPDATGVASQLRGVGGA